MTVSTENMPSVRLLNLGHLLDHYVILIFPTVVIALEAVYRDSYGRLLMLSWASFAAIGVFALPFGWLADHWSRRNMMVVYFIGTGLSAVAVGLSPNFTVLALALFALGVFAAIYHPVGVPILLEQAIDRGRVLALNGVAGNLGVSIAAVCTGFITSVFGWRFAFFIPALVFLAAGIAYLRLVPKDSQQRMTTPHADDIALDFRTIAIFVALSLVMSASGGLVFNILTIMLPKIVDVRAGADLPLIVVSGLATGIFLCGAAAQLTVGRLLGRVPGHILLATMTFAQFAGLWWVTGAHGWALLVALVVSVAAMYGQVTIGEVVFARYVPAQIRGRVYAARFFLTFAPAGPAVWWISHLYDTSGLDRVLWLMMATTGIFAAATLVLTALAFSVESRHIMAQAAE